MAYSQDDIFAASESDNYFARNKEALERVDLDADFPLKLMDLYRLRPRSVLEVGAANGFRLAAIAERYRAKAVAVEPSDAATRDGKSRFPSVEFVRAGASEIPLREPFDLVIVNYVFHWIDRVTLLRSVAEIDRLVVDGGFLIIGDFAPSNLIKVRYHHLSKEQVYTYKQNYAGIFLASGLYHSICLMTGDHSSGAPNAQVAEDERFGATLLRKMSGDHYVESSLRR